MSKVFDFHKDIKKRKGLDELDQVYSDLDGLAYNLLPYTSRAYLEDQADYGIKVDDSGYIVADYEFSSEEALELIMSAVLYEDDPSQEVTDMVVAAGEVELWKSVAEEYDRLDVVLEQLK